MDIKYKVILTNKAELELNEIYEYISKSLMAEKAAQALMKKFQDKILILEDIPEGFNVINEYQKDNKEYRKLVINNYVAVYRIDKQTKTVYILRIVYGGRNYLNEI